MNNMSTTNTNNTKFSEGQKAIGFDYQFYYFFFRALQLEEGESIGYEAKDDVHVDNQDGSTVLYQLKHSSQRKQNGEIINLPSLDIDLWHTLYNWINQIKTEENFLNIHSFVLVSNKNEGNNQFIEILNEFQTNVIKINDVKEKLKKLSQKTSSSEISNTIDEIITLEENKLCMFLKNIKIYLNQEDIASEIKNYLHDKLFVLKENIDVLFNDLFARLKERSFKEIKEKKKFILQKKELVDLYNNSSRAVVNRNRLPERSFDTIDCPENLEEMIFAKQLIDIEAVVINNEKTDLRLVRYCTQMLKSQKYLDYWLENSVISSCDIDDYQQRCVDNWQRIFENIYIDVINQSYSGENVNLLNIDIIDYGRQVFHNVQNLNLTISDYVLAPGQDFNNGYFWFLSNILKIGWCFDWERRYKQS